MGLFDRFRRGRQATPAEVAPDAAHQRIQRSRPRQRAEYDGASFGRRTASWRRNGRDANAELNSRVLAALRGIARDLVRNNPHAASGVEKWALHLVGAGITFQVYRNGKVDKDLTKVVKAHLESKSVDPLGVLNIYGMQYLSARTLVESGGVLWRRRWRRATDGLPLPFQIQVLEPDYINTQLSGLNTGGGYRLQGVEFDKIGRRLGYWLYSGHPGAVLPGGLDSRLILDSELAYCYRPARAEGLHGATWFAPIIARLKDFGEYEDAQLIRQKIAACFAVFKTGGDDGGEPTTDSNGVPIETDPGLTALEPGIVETLGPDQDVKFASPPGVDGYEPYSRVSLQAIFAGLGLPYETGTGDLSKVSFISGRLGRMDLKTAVETIQWLFLIPQICEPAGQWALDAAALAGHDIRGCEIRWTPPRFAMASPETEVPADRDAVRAGQKTPDQVLRERGEDPDTFWAEYAASMKRFDDLGLTLDIDPRRVTQVGNAVQPLTPQQMDSRGD